MRRLFILFNDNHSVVVTLKSAPNEIGGEGYIYRINFPHHGWCILKLYKNKDKAAKNRDKVLTLVRKSKPETKNANIRFCWPIGIAYEENRTEFVGYVMPEAFPNSRDLYILEYYGIGSTIKDEFPDDYSWHDKYELNTTRGLRNRLAILHNWAAALSVLHKSGEYILGDIKPTNVMVEPTLGKVSIIDIDSCQVSVNGKVIFTRTAQTPTYRPPEISARTGHNPIDENYDSFSFAVSAYTILTGTHPFSNCKLLPPYNTDEYASITNCIKAGLSPIGEKRNHTQKVTEYDLHKNLQRLPASLQNMFIMAFNSTNRPQMKAWKEALKSAIVQLDNQL